jgi:hypothetical protein
VIELMNYNAGALATNEIQDTAVGGCPHPNDAGHKKLAGVLSATYAGM